MPRQIVIALEQQRPDERVAYELTIDSSYAAPSAPACTLYDLSTDPPTDVSGTKLSGSPSLAGQVFTTPLVIDLVAESRYRLECQFVSGGSRFEPYFVIVGKA